jgi:hypothetical protein
MSALAAGHLEISILLIARGNGETVRRTERRPLHAWHFAVSGKFIFGHIQPLSNK